MSAARRRLCIGLSLWPLMPVARAQTLPANIEVWRSPSCGCCQDWIKYLESNGFVVKVNEGGNSAARRKFGLPGMYGSCHTAQIEGYVVEGHVPVREINRLLSEKARCNRNCGTGHADRVARDGRSSVRQSVRSL